MKKEFTLIIIIMMALSLWGCKKTQKDPFTFLTKEEINAKLTNYDISFKITDNTSITNFRICETDDLISCETGDIVLLYDKTEAKQYVVNPVKHLRMPYEGTTKITELVDKLKNRYLSSHVDISNTLYQKTGPVEINGFSCMKYSLTSNNASYINDFYVDEATGFCLKSYYYIESTTKTDTTFEVTSLKLTEVTKVPYTYEDIFMFKSQGQIAYELSNYDISFTITNQDEVINYHIMEDNRYVYYQKNSEESFLYDKTLEKYYLLNQDEKTKSEYPEVIKVLELTSRIKTQYLSSHVNINSSIFEYLGIEEFNGFTCQKYYFYNKDTTEAENYYLVDKVTGYCVKSSYYLVSETTNSVIFEVKRLIQNTSTPTIYSEFTETTYWPDVPLAKKIPCFTDGVYLNHNEKNGELELVYGKVTPGITRGYIETLKEEGYNEDIITDSSNNIITYQAYNSNDYFVFLSYNDGNLTILVRQPE